MVSVLLCLWELVLLIVLSMDKTISSLNVDSVAQSLNGSVGEQLIFVSHAIKDK